MKTVLLRRKLLWRRGSDFKSFDYVNHINAHPGYTARLSPIGTDSGLGTPWLTIPDLIVPNWKTLQPDVLFMHSFDWRPWLPVLALWPELPRINLIQAMPAERVQRVGPHALKHRAIRICISQQVADEFRTLGAVESPVYTIPNGIDLSAIPAPTSDQPTDLLIIALKQPQLGAQLADRLALPGRTIVTISHPRPRTDFLQLLASARVTLFLPKEQEGFYLPAIEGMAAGTLVVCPDVVGNRDFCLPGITSFRTDYRADALAAAAERALALPESDAAAMRQRATEMAANYSLVHERRAFHGILDHLDQIW